MSNWLLDMSDHDANVAAYEAFQRDLGAMESWRDRDETVDYGDEDDLPSDEELADLFADADDDEAEGDA